MSGLKEKVAKRLWWRVDQDKMDEQAVFSDSVAKKADDVVPLPVPVVP